MSAAKPVAWNHDALANDLARRIRDGGKVWTWCNLTVGAWSGPRPDIMTFARWRYDNPQIGAYEIKVQRSDLLSDLNSGKWRKYIEHCQSVTFAMPHGLATKDEIPAECGVMFRTGRGWRTERRPTNLGSPCSIQAMAKLLTCHPDREPRPGMSKWEADAEAGRCRDKFRQEAGQRFGHALARLASDVADGKDPAGEARKRADEILAEARAEADTIMADIKPLLAVLGVPESSGSWAVKTAVRKAITDLSADGRVQSAEQALTEIERALERAKSLLAASASQVAA